jgi:hypothetical protein
METIKQLSQAGSNGWGRDLGYGVVVLLVALSAYGLGRISAHEVSDPISLSVASTTPSGGLARGGLYVAALGGKVYYGPWCGQVKNMPPAKQIWFKSKDEARKAGYLPGACKGTE